MAGAAFARRLYSSPNEVPPDIPQPFSSSHMNSFRSAVVDVYRAAGMKLAVELDVDWKSQLGEHVYSINNFQSSHVSN